MAPEASKNTKARPAAVVDIGSNSIRLVVFRDRLRAPTVVFNERVICAIGRDMARTGRLHADGVAQALANLPRFNAVIRAAGVDDPALLATAATREAEDGPEFLNRVEDIFGRPAIQLDGDQEARLAAAGVLSGIPDAAGLVADLGGGSLELAGVGDGAVGAYGSLPLGPLRLTSSWGTERDALKPHIDDTLDAFDWIGEAVADGDIYIVGGAWRALARLHMVQTGYPLRVIHNYRISRRDTLEFCDVVAGLGESTLARIEAVPKVRASSLPLAALLLHRLVARSRPKQIVFSAYGIREGCLFDGLSKKARQTDPLIVACTEIAARESRFAGSGDLFFEWIAPLFADESAAERRLRHAACLLADIGWHEHPDYRAEQVYFRILRLQLLALTHVERAKIAFAVYRRYGGSRGDPALRVVDALLDDDATAWARRLGAALRLATTLSAGNFSLLAGVRLRLDGETLLLEVSRGHQELIGDVVRNRFGSLARRAGLEGQIVEES
jgi:exopolyphosphatase/guanosine-5'-triphosphate,3'-diphosphate pyrophosphatase